MELGLRLGKVVITLIEVYIYSTLSGLGLEFVLRLGIGLGLESR